MALHAHRALWARRAAHSRRVGARLRTRFVAGGLVDENTCAVPTQARPRRHDRAIRSALQLHVQAPASLCDEGFTDEEREAEVRERHHADETVRTVGAPRAW